MARRTSRRRVSRRRTTRNPRSEHGLDPRDVARTKPTSYLYYRTPKGSKRVRRIGAYGPDRLAAAIDNWRSRSGPGYRILLVFTSKGGLAKAKAKMATFEQSRRQIGKRSKASRRPVSNRRSTRRAARRGTRRRRSTRRRTSRRRAA
jgi:hypothetical protein